MGADGAPRRQDLHPSHPCLAHLCVRAPCRWVNAPCVESRWMDGIGGAWDPSKSRAGATAVLLLTRWTHGVQPLTAFVEITYLHSFMAAKLEFWSTFGFQRSGVHHPTPPRYATGPVKFKRCNFSHCFAWGEDFEQRLSEFSQPASESAQLESFGAWVSSFPFVFCPLLEGVLSRSLYLSDICGPPSSPPRLWVVNEERPACWYAEVGKRKSRSGLSEMRALCHE